MRNKPLKMFKKLNLSNMFILITGLTLLISCEEEPVEIQIPDGTYTGTFQRYCVWGDSQGISHVTLIFSSNNWSGTSEYEKYPALRHGTYSIAGDTITFMSGGAFSADFDWSLILQGKYLLKQSDSVIEFRKDYRSATSDTYWDQYILSRQEK
jgi:hypothetical protein